MPESDWTDDLTTAFDKLDAVFAPVGSEVSRSEPLAKQVEFALEKRKQEIKRSIEAISQRMQRYKAVLERMVRSVISAASSAIGIINLVTCRIVGGKSHSLGSTGRNRTKSGGASGDDGPCPHSAQTLPPSLAPFYAQVASVLGAAA